MKGRGSLQPVHLETVNQPLEEYYASIAPEKDVSDQKESADLGTEGDSIPAESDDGSYDPDDQIVSAGVGKINYDIVFGEDQKEGEYNEGVGREEEEDDEDGEGEDDDDDEGSEGGYDEDKGSKDKKEQEDEDSEEDDSDSDSDEDEFSTIRGEPLSRKTNPRNSKSCKLLGSIFPDDTCPCANARRKLTKSLSRFAGVIPDNVAPCTKLALMCAGVIEGDLTVRLKHGLMSLACLGPMRLQCGVFRLRISSRQRHGTGSVLADPVLIYSRFAMFRSVAGTPMSERFITRSHYDRFKVSVIAKAIRMSSDMRPVQVMMKRMMPPGMSVTSDVIIALAKNLHEIDGIQDTHDRWYHLDLLGIIRRPLARTQETNIGNTCLTTRAWIQRDMRWFVDMIGFRDMDEKRVSGDRFLSTLRFMETMGVNTVGAQALMDGSYWLDRASPPPLSRLTTVAVDESFPTEVYGVPLHRRRLVELCNHVGELGREGEGGEKGVCISTSEPRVGRMRGCVTAMYAERLEREMSLSGTCNYTVCPSRGRCSFGAISLPAEFFTADGRRKPGRAKRCLLEQRISTTGLVMAACLDRGGVYRKTEFPWDGCSGLRPTGRKRSRDRNGGVELDARQDRWADPSGLGFDLRVKVGNSNRKFKRLRDGRGHDLPTVALAGAREWEEEAGPCYEKESDEDSDDGDWGFGRGGKDGIGDANVVDWRADLLPKGRGHAEVISWHVPTFMPGFHELVMLMEFLVPGVLSLSVVPHPLYHSVNPVEPADASFSPRFGDGGHEWLHFSTVMGNGRVKVPALTLPTEAHKKAVENRALSIDVFDFHDATVMSLVYLLRFVSQIKNVSLRFYGSIEAANPEGFHLGRIIVARAPWCVANPSTSAEWYSPLVARPFRSDRIVASEEATRGSYNGRSLIPLVVLASFPGNELPRKGMRRGNLSIYAELCERLSLEHKFPAEMCNRTSKEHDLQHMLRVCAVVFFDTQDEDRFIKAEVATGVPSVRNEEKVIDFIGCCVNFMRDSPHPVLHNDARIEGLSMAFCKTKCFAETCLVGLVGGEEIDPFVNVFPISHTTAKVAQESVELRGDVVLAPCTDLSPCMVNLPYNLVILRNLHPGVHVKEIEDVLGRLPHNSRVIILNCPPDMVFKGDSVATVENIACLAPPLVGRHFIDTYFC